MAIGRISGPMLRSNLERQGVDLSIETQLLYVDVTNGRIGVQTNSPQVELDVAGSANISESVTIGSASNPGAINFLDNTGTKYVGFQAPSSIPSNITWTLPNTDGTPGYVLTTDGSSGLSWSEASSGTAANVLYVSKSGSDLNDGSSLTKAFLTIKAACAAATTGTTIFIKSGDYTEDNPVTIPTKVALIGDNLRTVTVRPANAAYDIFYVNNGCYVFGMTFRDHVSPTAAIAYNPDGSAGNITTSPYVQNCSSITTTGTGIYIDGSKTSGLKSMVMDAFTQFNQGGIGVHIDNMGYAQLVSIFTICCNVGVLTTNGGECSITNSNTSFGTYGLKASGISGILYSGVTDIDNQYGRIFSMSGLSKKPDVNAAISFDGGITFYTVGSATPLGPGGQSTVTILEYIPSSAAVGIGTTVFFYRRSFISASGQTMEYVGSGDNLATCLPYLGGEPDQTKEVVEENGGRVFFTSTDQKGDFRIGTGLTINRADGIITGRTFDKSLFAILTPYILAIEGS